MKDPPLRLLSEAAHGPWRRIKCAAGKHGTIFKSNLPSDGVCPSNWESYGLASCNLQLNNQEAIKVRRAPAES